MLQSVSSVFIVYRRKTLTGSLDPMHANGMNKPCIIGGESSDPMHVNGMNKPCIIGGESSL